MSRNDAVVENIAAWLYEMVHQKDPASAKIPYKQTTLDVQAQFLVMAAEIYEMVPVWYRKMHS